MLSAPCGSRSSNKVTPGGLSGSSGGEGTTGPSRAPGMKEAGASSGEWKVPRLTAIDKVISGQGGSSSFTLASSIGRASPNFASRSTLAPPAPSATTGAASPASPFSDAPSTRTSAVAPLSAPHPPDASGDEVESLSQRLVNLWLQVPRVEQDNVLLWTEATADEPFEERHRQLVESLRIRSLAQSLEEFEADPENLANCLGRPGQLEAVLKGLLADVARPSMHVPLSKPFTGIPTYLEQRAGEPQSIFTKIVDDVAGCVRAICYIFTPCLSHSFLVDIDNRFASEWPKGPIRASIVQGRRVVVLLEAVMRRAKAGGGRIHAFFALELDDDATDHPKIKWRIDIVTGDADFASTSGNGVRAGMGLENFHAPDGGDAPCSYESLLQVGFDARDPDSLWWTMFRTCMNGLVNRRARGSLIMFTEDLKQSWMRRPDPLDLFDETEFRTIETATQLEKVTRAKKQNDEAGQKRKAGRVRQLMTERITYASAGTADETVLAAAKQPEVPAPASAQANAGFKGRALAKQHAAELQSVVDEVLDENPMQVEAEREVRRRKKDIRIEIRNSMPVPATPKSKEAKVHRRKSYMPSVRTTALMKPVGSKRKQRRRHPTKKKPAVAKVKSPEGLRDTVEQVTAFSSNDGLAGGSSRMDADGTAHSSSWRTTETHAAAASPPEATTVSCEDDIDMFSSVQAEPDERVDLLKMRSFKRPKTSHTPSASTPELSPAVAYSGRGRSASTSTRKRPRTPSPPSLATGTAPSASLVPRALAKGKAKASGSDVSAMAAQKVGSALTPACVPAKTFALPTSSVPLSSGTSSSHSVTVPTSASASSVARGTAPAASLLEPPRKEQPALRTRVVVRSSFGGGFPMGELPLERAEDWHDDEDDEDVSSEFDDELDEEELHSSSNAGDPRKGVKQRRWTTKENDIIRAGRRNDGKVRTFSDIAKQLGRSADATTEHARGLRQFDEKAGRGGEWYVGRKGAWTAQELAQLVSLMERGLTWQKVSEAFGGERGRQACLRQYSALKK
ncbi:hypothetical protein JCM3770_003351 [Rhodotorula araucariae]